MNGSELTATRTLVLVGYRASGKTTLGRRCAEAMRRSFFDVDLEIEFAHGISIREMFAQHGEAWFRDVEEATVADLLTRPGIVVALGGGAVLRPATRQRLRAATVTPCSCVPRRTR